MLDFSKKLKNSSIEKKVNPIEIYNSIDRKSITGPLRAIQERILTSWYRDYKDNKDLIIKLHTGVGKTLIGLLILQSKLNSGEGPCLYICPDKYLTEQVQSDARKFGIAYCEIDKDNELPKDFVSKKSILITYASKVFNGRSIFGVNRSLVKIGAVVLDDAHSCADVIQNSFRIFLNREDDKEIFEAFLELFKDDLEEQGAGNYLEIQDGNFSTSMLLPYWNWQSKSKQALTLLNKYKENLNIKFAWEFVKNNINDFDFYISGTKIEIVPQYSFIKSYSSFNTANCRILMSATTQSDAFFITKLGLSASAVKSPLTDLEQLWYGEKMFIIPALMYEGFHDDTLIDRVMKITSDKFGTVVLVPSKKVANKYISHGAVLANENLKEAVESLKSKKFDKKYVIANRYDGIDLPDEACRILIVEGKPYYDSLYERYEEICRPTSETMMRRTIQRIEQAFGRSVRGEKDYSAIIILGGELVKFINNNDNNGFFSVQTRNQLALASDLAEMVEEEYKEDDSVDDIFDKTVMSLLRKLIGRDEGWKQYYEQYMNDNSKAGGVDVALYDILEKESLYQSYLTIKDYDRALTVLQGIVNSFMDNSEECGWYMQLMASVKYKIDKVESDKLQISAFKLNNCLLKPQEGVHYKKIALIDGQRFDSIMSFYKNFQDNKSLMIEINDIIEKLVFGTEAEVFEDAVMRLGQALGFESQRPDKMIRKGPDNLWAIASNEYIMFECKSEVYENRQFISKKEVGQMNNHCGWFEEEYKGSKVTRVMIISTNKIAYDANFTQRVQIMRRGKLKELREAFKDFYIALTRSYEMQGLTPTIVNDYLNKYGLDLESLKKYNEPFIR